MKNNNNLTPIEYKEQLIKISAYYYPNPLSQRKEITNDLKNKSGVYCWFNTINGNFYIGSVVNLNLELMIIFKNISTVRSKKKII